MDVDWCLSCSKHIHNGNSPYCSEECRAGPSRLPSHPPTSCSGDISDHDDDNDEEQVLDDDERIYTSHHYAGIEAWAAAIPAGASAHLPPPSRPASARSSRAPSISSSSSKCSPTSVSTVTYRPPNLLKPHRSVPATLCMSKASPKPSSPSLPITTPQQQLAAEAAQWANTSSLSTGGHTSLESSLATPASSKALQFGDRHKSSSSGVLDQIACHVRSWVAPSPLASLPHHHHLDKASRFPDEYSDDDEGTPIFIAQVAKSNTPNNALSFWTHGEMEP